jgi:predicted GTPase
MKITFNAKEKPITAAELAKKEKELREKYESYFSTGNHSLNILIAGLSGVGKSTLINGIFGENVARTGVGRPVTQEIEYYPGSERKIGGTDQKSQVSFYDTVGLEMSEAQRKKVSDQIADLMKKENSPHLCWYCVSAEGARIQEKEFEFINSLGKFNIPVIVVLTQSYTAEKADALEAQIRKENLNICDVIQVVAIEKTQHDVRRGDFTLKSFGLAELVQASLKYFQQFAKEGKYDQIVNDSVNEYMNVLINEQIVDKKSKRNKAKKAIVFAVGTAAGIGAAPIPFADAPFLTGVQETMLLQIGRIYQ